MTQGWALIGQGLEADSIEQMRQGLAVHQATGSEVIRPHFLALLVEALGRTDQKEAGLHLLREALAMVNRSGERCYEAELYRLQGELLLKQSSHCAEQCFHQAIKVARQQQAKSWELRAATSLARVYQQRGKSHEARTVLKEIYNWFTEGFDTADLREAKALLDQLPQATAAG